MASEKITAIVESVKTMTVLELKELVDTICEEFGVSAVAAAAPAAAGAAAPAEEEKTEFDVILADVGANKMQVIKTVKELTGASLMEAKKLVETPNAKLKEQASKADAEDIQKKLAEVGVVLCLYCGLLSILYKEMTLKSFYNLLADTMESSATILFLIAASSIMSYVMSYSGIPAAISNALMSVSSNRYVILLIMNVFLLVMGMFLDLTPAVLIFTPIFLPITRSIGMSDVQFGIMLIMNLGIGSVTPPVGSCLFVGCGVGKVKIEGVTKYIVPLFAAMVVALFLVTFIPAIALVVPYLCGLVPSLGWTM